MDALSDVLRVVRLTGGVFLDAEFTAPWCVTAQVGPEDCRPFLSAPQHLIAYHCVVDGCLLLQTDGTAPVEVRAGEIVLLPRNDAHRIGSSLDAQAIKADDLIQAPKNGGLARIVHGGGGERTRVVCGFLGCETPFNPLVATLPRVMKLNMRAAASGQWIESSFQFAASEVSADRMGSATVLSKLHKSLGESVQIETLKGQRDRAILSVFLFHALRREELCTLQVADRYVDRGVTYLRVHGKGGKTRSIPLHPETVQRISDYLESASHREDTSARLFQSVRGTSSLTPTRMH